MCDPDRLDALLDRIYQQDPAALMAALFMRGDTMRTIDHDRDLVDRPRRGVWTIAYNRNRDVWQVYNDRARWVFTCNTHEQARLWAHRHALLPRDLAQGAVLEVAG